MKTPLQIYLTGIEANLNKNQNESLDNPTQPASI